MHFTSLGGAYEIGASCHMMQAGGRNILLDCGIRPGESDAQQLPDFNRLQALTEGRVDLILLSHAHVDHVGALPLLRARFPSAPILCTRATKVMSGVVLSDVTQKADAEFPLWSQEQVDAGVRALRDCAFGEWVEPIKGVRVCFHPAGHVLGAAAILVETEDGKVAYSGDFSTTVQRMTAAMPAINFFEPDLLILEGTHGDVSHPGRKVQEQRFAGDVAQVMADGGTVLIPSRPFGRAQEALLVLKSSMMTCLIPRFPIYVDGSVADTCDAHEGLVDELPEKLRRFLLNSQQPLFWTDGAANVPKVVRVDPKARGDLFTGGPKCIFTSSFRLTRGPSAEYARVLADGPRNAIFLTDDEDEESTGEPLASLDTGDVLPLDDGGQVTVRCRVERFQLAMHADQIQLCQHVSYMNPKSLVLVHGRPTALQALRAKLMDRCPVFVPLNGDTFDPVAQPEAKARGGARDGRFVARILEDEQGVALRFDDDLFSHRSWQQFFQGYDRVEARFDGRRLRLKAVVDEEDTP